ncbi:MAG: sodium:calcium antiporter, partial [SAR324 cluster bacterium]|nr:sodium:calcium antiporter [SAR324 cluster bacterium]
MALTIISSFFKASLGVAALLWGASLLVRGGGSIALKFGVSPLVVGILVLAFGTSSPELFISAHSTLSNQDGIAIGNVIG